MTDYTELQKRCQRGCVALSNANNLLAECYAAIGNMTAENESLRKIASELRRGSSCESVHHDHREQHEFDEPCKVLARIDVELSREC